MADRYVLVLDMGTTGPKCLVFDDGGQIIGSCAHQWSYISEHDTPHLARSFDPHALWESVCGLITSAITSATGSAAASSDQIPAVAVTSQRQGVVFLDSDGHELYAGPNLDLRAIFEGGAIDEEMGESVYRTTGHLPSFLFTAAKLRWFQIHRPEAYDRIASVLTLADWLVWRLTGSRASESTLAAEAGLLDIHSRDWCTNLMDDMGLVTNSVPLVEAGTIVGKVGAGVSRETGLPLGTPVVAAGADTQCGLLGMGAAQVYQVGIVAGWSAPLQMVTPEPLLSPEARTWVGCFPAGHKWVLESSAGDIGNSYRWVADNLYGDTDNAFERMDRTARAIPVGSEGAVAVLGPSRMNMGSVGMRPGGLMFPVPLTYSEFGRGHLVRACLEAAAYAVRANLEQCEELATVQARDIAVGGGMTRTSTWVTILADVLGRETGISPTPQASALGAYLCACTAVGQFDSLEEASQSVRSRLRVVEPDALNSAEYQDYYERWVMLSNELQRIGV